jgi:hypothetical protein
MHPRYESAIVAARGHFQSLNSAGNRNRPFREKLDFTVAPSTGSKAMPQKRSHSEFVL